MNIAQKNTQLNVFILYEPDNRFDYATKPEHDNQFSNKKNSLQRESNHLIPGILISFWNVRQSANVRHRSVMHPPQECCTPLRAHTGQFGNTLSRATRLDNTVRIRAHGTLGNNGIVIVVCAVTLGTTVGNFIVICARVIGRSFSTTVRVIRANTLRQSTIGIIRTTVLR
ncbi:uncharacterized protein LOC113472740 [Diaphorina citri]|uniref:Uncharacterized protein LOC113472740 n=1 Tax=Diaphorina citri TaxID=121845 RepID=A0A3Q0JIV5_DIACI|nr:uncharacterized protein LOC113472740 [Diaphorina citri]